ncbi:hypothetical protein H6P81_016244 [Aristolochia fimbriata]|uniref:Homeobox domain-containing protein n=1 Tax=Aristolochia fimbriata TaxID=158543 RepID=A0AAV7E863_ARIFI|nr:hypothetical protein H6P81_016244 [Aristolochia fimbriata]
MMETPAAAANNNSTASAGSSSTSSSTSSSRWNPTKEQINVLEGLYREGLRTPTAEQIQQITSRLKAYGHIEGKNVFYWFQNHKARQRQKQKQEGLLYVSRYFRHSSSSPILPSNTPCTNHQYVGCNPYCVPAPGMTALYSDQIPKLALPVPRNQHYYCFKPPTKILPPCDDHGHETLELFPLQPTGILAGIPSSSSSRDQVAESLTSSTITVEGSSNNMIVGDHQRFFNFFA